MIAFNLNCLLFDERTVLVVLYKDTQGGITMSMKNRPSKPWYKVWWVWLIIVVVVFSVIGVSGENSGSSSSSSDSSSTQTHSTPKKESSQKASASVSSESNSKIPNEYKNALKSAQTYADTMHMSKGQFTINSSQNTAINFLLKPPTMVRHI